MPSVPPALNTPLYEILILLEEIIAYELILNMHHQLLLKYNFVNCRDFNFGT